MSKLRKRVLSLDIATTTGWSFLSTTDIKKLKFGTIVVDSKLVESKRLVYFKEELTKLLIKFKPTHVVIEDVYFGNNTKTLKLLSKFAGVAQACCMEKASIDPYIIHNNTVKSYFKVKNKKELFSFVISIIEQLGIQFNFKDHNDIVDSIAQLLCYIELVLKVDTFRKNTNYGYLYEV